MTSVLDHAPSKIVAVHLNYRSRAAQRGRAPGFPSYFLKPPSSVAGPDDPLTRPAGCELLGFEGEIALVIGERTRGVSPAEGWARVRWVTAANDAGIYDLRYADRGSNLRSKGGDGFTPIGPRLLDARAIDPAALRVRTWVDDELVQDDTSAELFFDFGTLVADLSRTMTLEAGDVILTGTPAGASVARPGQVVSVEVSAGELSTGRLSNPVVDGPALAEYGAMPKADAATREIATGQAEPSVLTAELSALLNSVGTATVSSQLRKRGLNNMSIDGVVPLLPGLRLLGTAHTLRFVPSREDLFTTHGGGYNAQKQAVNTVGPGQVLVMDAQRDPSAGTLGDILALRCKVRGAAGVVTDAAIRDHDAVAEIGLPVYSAGSHPAVLGRRHVPWEVGATIACGGTVVQPGDILVGDADGVVVLPPALADEVARAAEEQELAERFIAEQVAAGESIDGLYPIGPQWRDRYEQWKQGHRPS